MKSEELTFENVIEPFIIEEEQVLYAFHTLWTRMVTDWPISEEWQTDFLKVGKRLHNYMYIRSCNLNALLKYLGMYLEMKLEAKMALPKGDVSLLLWNDMRRGFCISGETIIKRKPFHPTWLSF